ncbi:MAG: hypothetical protein JO223_24285 [Hyphomicrobiales bacterium]|nr:hypothetical protein [Hyphomicrobiales bacterium]MBV8440613.1 hypothetical protein [Hyphomicrobiales bacterium]
MPVAGGLPMIVREIVLTCSNPHVARAAVASIGGDFARRFSRDAASRNLSSGLLASHLVRHFARRAGDTDWEGVDEATRGADQPILSGLRYILERGLELLEDGRQPREGWIPPRPSLSCGDAWRNCA